MRKSHVIHKVRTHQRISKSVDSYSRGNGNPSKPAIGKIHKPKVKQFRVFPYENQDQNVIVKALTKQDAIIKGSRHPDFAGLPIESLGALEVKIPDPKLQHFVVKYRTTWKDRRTNVDTMNVYVEDKSDIVSNIHEMNHGHIPPHKQPKIKIIRATLQAPQKPRLKVFFDVDNRTRSRMRRGYILDYVKISDIDLPPVRKQLRFDDNYQKMKATKGMPPAHLYFKLNGRYGISDGVHRIHAAKELGYDRVPILVKYGDD